MLILRAKNRTLYNKAVEVLNVEYRLGVKDQDFEEFELIELPVKRKDKRASGFLERHGERCAEIDALPASELRGRVEHAIKRHIDAGRWSKLLETEAHEKESVRSVILQMEAE